MKYLPDKFPIRYAIIAHSHPEDKYICDDDYIHNISLEKFFFRQLISLLQEEPITQNLLRIGYSGFFFDIDNTRLLNLVKIHSELLRICMTKS